MGKKKSHPILLLFFLSFPSFLSFFPFLLSFPSLPPFRQTMVQKCFVCQEIDLKNAPRIFSEKNSQNLLAAQLLEFAPLSFQVLQMSEDSVICRSCLGLHNSYQSYRAKLNAKFQQGLKKRYEQFSGNVPIDSPFNALPVDALPVDATVPVQVPVSDPPPQNSEKQETLLSEAEKAEILRKFSSSSDFLTCLEEEAANLAKCQVFHSKVGEDLSEVDFLELIAELKKRKLICYTLDTLAKNPKKGSKF